MINQNDLPKIESPQFLEDPILGLLETPSHLMTDEQLMEHTRRLQELRTNSQFMRAEMRKGMQTKDQRAKKDVETLFGDF